MFQYCVRQSAEVENLVSIVCVSVCVCVCVCVCVRVRVCVCVCVCRALPTLELFYEIAKMLFILMEKHTHVHYTLLCNIIFT